MIGSGYILGFFWLVLSWKGDKDEGIHQLLIKFWLFGLIVTGVLFGFLDWWLEIVVWLPASLMQQAAFLVCLL